MKFCERICVQNYYTYKNCNASVSAVKVGHFVETIVHFLMLPAHFLVTHDHIWSKILQELKKSPTRNTRAVLKSKLRAMPKTKHEYYTSITPKNLSYFHELYLCYPPTFTMLPTIIFCKNSAGAHIEPNTKCKSYEQCRTKHEYYNNKAPHFLTAGLQILPI